MAIAQKTSGPRADAEQSTASRRVRAHALRRLSHLLPPPLVAIALGLILQLIYELELVSPLVLPSPLDTMDEIARQAVNSVMWSNLWVTTQEALIGFVIGSISGVVLGAGIALSKWTSRALYPYVVLMQSMPRIALVPVFIAMLGFGMGAKIVTAVVLCFFPPLINTIVGLREVNEDAMTMMKSLCATKWQIMRKLLWPSALPAILGGVKTALTLAFLGAFVGELTAANEGVGLLINTATSQLAMPLLFAYVFWFSVLSLVLYGALEVLDNRLIFWKGAQRRDIFGHED